MKKISHSYKNLFFLLAFVLLMPWICSAKLGDGAILEAIQSSETPVVTAAVEVAQQVIEAATSYVAEQVAGEIVENYSESDYTVADFVSDVQESGGLGNGGVASTVADAAENGTNDYIDQVNTNISNFNNTNTNGISLPEIPNIQIETGNDNVPYEGTEIGNQGNYVSIINENGTSLTVTQGGFGIKIFGSGLIGNGDNVEVDLKSGYVVGTTVDWIHSEEYQQQLLLAGIVYAAATANGKEELAKVALGVTNLLVYEESAGNQKYSTKIFNLDGSINYGCENSQPFYIIPPDENGNPGDPNSPYIGDPNNPYNSNNPICDDSCACAENICIGDYCINQCEHLCQGKNPDYCGDSSKYCAGLEYVGVCGEQCIGTGGGCGDTNEHCVGSYEGICGENCIGTKQADCSRDFEHCLGANYPSGNECPGLCTGKANRSCLPEMQANYCKYSGYTLESPCSLFCPGTKDPKCATDVPSDAGSDYCIGTRVTLPLGCGVSCLVDGTKNCDPKCAVSENGEVCRLTEFCDEGHSENLQPTTTGWTWDCVGDDLNSSDSVSCSATQKCQDNDKWIEVNPTK